MLHSLNQTLPCGIAGLPDELQVEIVRHAVTSSDNIPVEALQEKTNDLLSPFHGFKRLREEAEDNVMRVNTFSWEISAEDISADTTSITNLSQCGPLRPFVKDVEHLQLRLSILLEGGKFDAVDDLFRSGWDKDVVRRLRTLQDTFPKLRKLDLQIENRGDERRPHVGISAALRQLVYDMNGDLHLKGCPHFERFKKEERLFQMHKLLLLIGAVGAPKLWRKTVMFVQSADTQSCTRPAILGDSGFGEAATSKTTEIRTGKLQQSEEYGIGSEHQEEDVGVVRLAAGEDCLYVIEKDSPHPWKLAGEL